jgi:L-2-hydroxyglutarate oxidase LhgO
VNAEVEVVVVGAGLVGLATAAALARAGRSVLVVERQDGIAREGSSRSSEVIHAGIYYPPGSWKARLCVAGREALYARCHALGIPHRRLGKLVVATREAERAVLEELRARGEANGVPGLEILDAAEVARLEPALHAVAALHSPASGILDTHALALSYAAEAEAHGVDLVLRTELLGAQPLPSGGLRARLRDAHGESAELRCAALVNAAGLSADRVAERLGLDPDARGYRQHFCKGDYFALAPGAPVRVSRLVYPVPGTAGLGIHATLDLGGRIRFGPDAEYVPEPRFDVDPAKAKPFAEAVARYLPAVRAEWLSPDYAGVRAKLAGPGEGFRDFVVAEESEAGLPGVVSLVGIESPGITAAPAIAGRVCELLQGL